MDRHRDDASHLRDASKREALAGLLVRGLLRHLHSGTILGRRHGTARLGYWHERKPASVGSLLTEQAKQCSQEEKEEKTTFHGINKNKAQI